MAVIISPVLGSPADFGVQSDDPLLLCSSVFIQTGYQSLESLVKVRLDCIDGLSPANEYPERIKLPSREIGFQIAVVPLPGPVSLQAPTGESIHVLDSLDIPAPPDKALEPVVVVVELLCDISFFGVSRYISFISKGELGSSSSFVMGFTEVPSRMSEQTVPSPASEVSGTTEDERSKLFRKFKSGRRHSSAPVVVTRADGQRRHWRGRS